MNELVASVNHDGDSDSTGAITRNILGAYLGVDKIPSDLICNIELNELLNILSNDLYNGYNDDISWMIKYPML